MGNVNNTPFKVLHITFDMGLGGTEQVIRQLVTATAEADVENTILCIDGKAGPIGDMLMDQGVEVLQYPRASRFDRNLIGFIRKLILDCQFDIVHCHQYTPYLYGFLGAIFTPAKVVFTEHGRFHPDRYRYKAIAINPLMALFTPAIVAISAATKQALSHYEFMPAFKINVIYNGIQGLERSPQAEAQLREQLGIAHDAYIVGTVARLDPVKNQAMMLRAFKRFLKVYPDSVLLMVGDGPDREQLVKLSIELGIENEVIFTGFISKPVNHLALMNMFLLSSFTEGTSMTLLEAMSLGVPAVATSVGGNPEIIKDGVTGLLAPSDDDDVFSEQMLKIRSDIKLAGALAKNSVECFNAGFSVSKMARSYMDVYRSVLS